MIDEETLERVVEFHGHLCPGLAMGPDAWSRDPEHQALFAKVRAGSATDAERARFGELHVSQSRKVLALAPDDLYLIEEVHSLPPRKARIHTSAVCAECGEAAMETRVRRLDGRELCQPCFDAALAPEQPVTMRRP